MPSLFLVRRMMLAYSVVWVPGEGAAALVPMLLFFWSSWVVVEVLISSKPYERRKDNSMEIFNEATLLCLMSFLLGFTSWLPVADLENDP